jgi:hypothetical protein
MCYTLCSKNNGGVLGGSVSKYSKGNTMDIAWILQLLIPAIRQFHKRPPGATACPSHIPHAPAECRAIFQCVCGRLLMFTTQEKAWCALLLAEHKLVITVQHAFRRELRKILHMRITLDDAFISFKKRVAFQNR